MGYKLIKYFLPNNFVSSLYNFVTLVVIILHNIRYYVTYYICK